jgi:hypothetical protein
VPLDRRPTALIWRLRRLFSLLRLAHPLRIIIKQCTLPCDNSHSLMYCFVPSSSALPTIKVFPNSYSVLQHSPFTSARSLRSPFFRRARESLAQCWDHQMTRPQSRRTEESRDGRSPGLAWKAGLGFGSDIIGC